MEYITISNSNLKVSRLAMGGCPMGGYGWGQVDDKDLIRAVHAAVDAGITMFDTADTYGLGKSEKVLGQALGSKRNNVVIATKFGVRVENGRTFYDNSPEYIRKALNRSLERFDTDYIDLYQVHYRDGVTPISSVVDTMEELKKAGKIRYYGLSNIHENDLEELKTQAGKFVSFQDEYSLACRKNEKDMIKISEALSLTPFTWGSLGQGILTGKYDAESKFGSDDRRSREIYVNFHGEKLKKNLEIVKVLKEIAQEVERPVPAVAIRFILDHIPSSVVLAGIKNPRQLESNCQAFDWNLNFEQIKRLDEVSRL